mmetsp:Transcript_8983/g.12359  ORF Transcript_8983/g.12359 Transcript_8983/m.12359 type:complete len:195 (-) Transcript_8983:39-623(-)
MWAGLWTTGFDAQEILDGLYLGSVDAASDLEELKKRNISHILTAAHDIDPKFSSEIEYLIVQVDDWPAANLLHSFDVCIEYIDKVRSQKGSVLVHCQAGISRSTTVVCAYLMKTQNMKFDEALKFIQEKRKFVSPNHGFRSQLKLFERLGHNLAQELMAETIAEDDKQTLKTLQAKKPPIERWSGGQRTPVEKY